MAIQIASPTPEEKMRAALAHLLGPLIALIIWATQKDKSPFVRFQAMQALAFDAALVLVGVLGAGVAVLFVFFSSIISASVAAATPSNGDSSSPPALLVLLLGLTPLCVVPLMIIFALGAVVGRFIAAVSVFQGNDFHYPWLGKRVERFLAQRK